LTATPAHLAAGGRVLALVAHGRAVHRWAYAAGGVLTADAQHPEAKCILAEVHQ